MPGQGSPSLHRHLDPLGTAAARGREGGKGRPLPFSTHMESALQAINPLRSPDRALQLRGDHAWLRQAPASAPEKLRAGDAQHLPHTAPQPPITLPSARKGDARQLHGTQRGCRSSRASPRSSTFPSPGTCSRKKIPIWSCCPRQAGEQWSPPPC